MINVASEVLEQMKSRNVSGLNKTETNEPGSASSNDETNEDPKDSKGSICCISFNSTDCIRLIGHPSILVAVIRSTITDSWGEIKKEEDYHGGYQFKLKDDPWIKTGEMSVRSRALLVAILTSMLHHGWHLLQAADTSKKVHDKDSLYFERGEPDPAAKLIGMSFNKGNRIRLINHPTDPFGNLRRVFLDTVLRSPIKLLQSKEYFGSFEITLEGEPWNCGEGAEDIRTKLLLIQLLAGFRAVGYKLYASVDISRGGINGSDLESWVFRKIISELTSN